MNSLLIIFIFIFAIGLKIYSDDILFDIKNKSTSIIITFIGIIGIIIILTLK